MMANVRSRVCNLVLFTSLISIATVSFGQTIINVPSMPAPSVARNDEIVNVLPGGFLSDGFDALDGSEVNLLGGIFGRRFEARGGSLVNIDSGVVEGGFIVFSTAEVNVSGATLDGMTVSGDGVLNVSGGAFGDLSTQAGSSVTLIGFDFKVGRMAIDGLDTSGLQLQFDSPDDKYLSGIFADGTPFILEGNRLADGTVTLVRSEFVPVIRRRFKFQAISRRWGCAMDNG